MLNLNQRGLVAHRRENINLLRKTEKAVFNALINGEPEKAAAIMNEAYTDDFTHSMDNWLNRLKEKLNIIQNEIV